MSSTLIVSAHNLGKARKRLFDDFSVPFPPDLGDDGGLTLRKLITRIVLAETQAFRDRQEKRRLTRVLSSAQIEEAAQRGKVDSGPSDLAQTVVDADAVATALQAFEDGLYLVIIDGAEQRHLDAQVYVKPGSRITFVRLVFLAGA